MKNIDEAQKQYGDLVDAVTDAYVASIETDQQAIKAGVSLAKVWADDFAKLMAAGRIELTEEEHKKFLSHSLHSYGLLRAMDKKLSESDKTTH